MKINKLHVSNLYSFENEELVFEDYNIIVGPNASGKTNLVRILSILVNDIPFHESPTPMALNDVPLERRLKFDVNKPSSVVVDLSLSKNELRFLLQFIMRKTVTKLDYYELGKLTLVIYWPSTPNEKQSPALVLLRFVNGFALWNIPGQHRMGFIKVMPESAEDLYGLILQCQEISGNLENEFYNRHGFTKEKLLDRIEFQEAFLAGNNLEGFSELWEKNVSLPYHNIEIRYSSLHPEDS